MNKAEMISLFQRCYAYQEGHFRLAGGKHTNRYVQCAHLTEHADVTEKVCHALIEALGDTKAKVVVSPAIGGMIFGFEVSRQKNLRYVYTERKDGAMILHRGFDIEKDTPVLVVEDVVTTGGSVREVMEIVRALGGHVVNVACLVDRSGGKVDFGVPFVSLISYDVEAWDEKGCPLCEKGTPVTKPVGRL